MKTIVETRINFWREFRKQVHVQVHGRFDNGKDTARDFPGTLPKKLSEINNTNTDFMSYAMAGGGFFCRKRGNINTFYLLPNHIKS